MGDSVEVSHAELKLGVDHTRYYITNSAYAGTITCRIRKREEVRMETAIVAARSELRSISPS